MSTTHTMDYQFPQQLFPSFYNCGPPISVLKHSAGNWGSYDRVRPQGGSGPLSSWTFTSRHQVKGEVWRHTEPVPVPLFSPKNSVLWPLMPPDPLDFTEHMQNFFVDHSVDAFGCVSEALHEDFNFKKKPRGKRKCREESFHLAMVKKSLNTPKHKMYHKRNSRSTLTAYGSLMSDVVHAIPPELLGGLLYEELREQRDQLLFSDGATGGALAFVPFPQSDGGTRHGCLLYPRNKGMDCLNFQRVELQHHREGSSCVNTSSIAPVSFQLKFPIRQISSVSLFNDCCAAVRSDHLCGVWRFSEGNEPRLLQVISTKERATCISVSPHVLGEVLVVSESGEAKLWTVGRGLQEVRVEDHNLYFNAKSSWRWCEFSAHPRVMLYADRTGVELTDIRVNPALCHTLFRISNTSACRSGERLILSRYLGDVHTFHHLITTQYSAYVMDERFPSMPMLKWDHMMESPPIFCHVVSGSASSGSGGGDRTTKLLLGAQRSQEITLLQYSGGRAQACTSRGPPQALLRLRDSLKHLPVQIPHRLDTAHNRVSSPAAGLTCIQKKGGGEASDEECICVLQLTEAGDIFYQILQPDVPDTSQPPEVEDEPPPPSAAKKTPKPGLKEATASGRKTAERLIPDSLVVVSDTSSDEGVIEPTPGVFPQRLVPETQLIYSDSSSEDSDTARKARKLKRLCLQVAVNDTEWDGVSGQDAGGKDGNVEINGADKIEDSGRVGETVSSTGGSDQVTQIKLSPSALVTWKRWLQILTTRSCDKKPHPPSPPPTAGDLLQLSGKAKESKEAKRLLASLRHDLRACMSKRSLLLHGSASSSFGDLEVVPIPNPVDTDAWTDPISQRLTVSWQGEEAWRAWWVDKLGLNMDAKMEALRRKRRREKDAKRASGRGLQLSGSFTSSVTYQSDLDDFSNSTGWSSATSQRAWSENEGTASQLGDFQGLGTPRAATPSSVQADTPATTPQRQQVDQLTPRSSHSLGPSQTPKPDSIQTAQKRNNRAANNYLSSLFTPQDEPSQHDSYFLDEGDAACPTPIPFATSSQLHSSRSIPQMQSSGQVNLSQSTSTSFSQSQSQRSLGRQGLSQASQPKKKRSQMGF